MSLTLINKIFKILNSKEKFLVFLCFIFNDNKLYSWSNRHWINNPFNFFFVEGSNQGGNSFKIFSHIREVFKNFELKDFLILIIFIYLFKNIYITFYHYFTLKTSLKIRNRLVHNIYSKYLGQNLSFYTKRSSPEIIRNIYEIQDFYIVIDNYLTLILELIIFTTFFSFLIILNPTLTLYSFITALVLIYFINKIWKKKFYLFGKSIQTFRKAINRFIIENFINIKLIKAKQIENKFSGDFSRLDYSLAKITFKSDFLLQLPRAIIETLAVFFLCIIIFDSLGKISKIEIITYLGVLVAILVRLMPGATRIILLYKKLNFLNQR